MFVIISNLNFRRFLHFLGVSMSKKPSMSFGILRPHVFIGRTMLTLIGHDMPTDISWCDARLNDMNHRHTLSHISKIRVKGFSIADFRAEYDKKHGERAFNGAFAVQAEWNQKKRVFTIMWSRDLHRFPIGGVLENETIRKKKPTKKVHC